MKLKPILKWSLRVILVALVLSILGAFIGYWRSTNDCDRQTGTPVHPMKAIRYCEYSSPDDVLKLEQVEKPVPNDIQILVRVRAVSLRFFDGGMLRGGVGRLIFGLRKPKNTCPGSDFSGTVEAVGGNVTEFKPGDEVFG
ncbi:MAG: alcohol dehydrogenase catalytic domain-containing protein, partial [Chthoniobacterales bacterium]